MSDLLIQIICGVIGGSAAGRVLKKSSLGLFWNSVFGVIGGSLGARILGLLSPSLGMAAESGSFDIGSIMASIVGGGVGGGILLASIKAIKTGMAKK